MNKTLVAKAEKHLSEDPVMKGLMGEHGRLKWDWESEPFRDIVNSIVGQQLSDKAADTIFKRFEELLGRKELNAVNTLELSEEDMRECGISYAKIGYIKGFGKAVESGELSLTALEKLSNDEVIDELTKIKGIGSWTAEMFLMFSLKRPDVFSVGDLGLRNAVSDLYGVERKNRSAILEISKKWKPYRTFASRYLWKSSD